MFTQHHSTGQNGMHLYVTDNLVKAYRSIPKDIFSLSYHQVCNIVILNKICIVE